MIIAFGDFDFKLFPHRGRFVHLPARKGIQDLLIFRLTSSRKKYPLCDIFAMEDQHRSLAQETRVKMFGNEDLIDRQILSFLEDS
jgi:hypothetical protein